MEGTFGEPNPPGARVREVILPVLDRWLDHKKAGMSYHVTRISGHGSFGQYLHRFGKRDTPECRDCGERIDTPVHVLEACPRWSAYRRDLITGLGPQVELKWKKFFPSILEEKDKWLAMTTFARKDITEREAAEHALEREERRRRKEREAAKARRRQQQQQQQRRSAGGEGDEEAQPGGSGSGGVVDSSNNNNNIGVHSQTSPNEIRGRKKRRGRDPWDEPGRSSDESVYL